MRRPSPKELCQKVANALAALRANRYAFATMRHWAGDSDELGLQSSNQLWPLLIVLLEEIRVAGPEKTYAGTFPPMRGYQEERAIKDEELWPFTWQSTRMGKQMYLKFVLTKNRSGDWHFFHLDCHESASQ